MHPMIFLNFKKMESEVCGQGELFKMEWVEEILEDD